MSILHMYSYPIKEVAVGVIFSMLPPMFLCSKHGDSFALSTKKGSTYKRVLVRLSDYQEVKYMEPLCVYFQHKSWHINSLALKSNCKNNMQVA